jgi:carboxylesterase
MKRKSSCLRVFVYAALVAALLVAALVAYLFWPVNARSMASHPDPAADYADAAARVDALIAEEGSLNPLCRAQLLTHGQKTRRVVVFVHGYTTCPQQYRELAPRVFDQGDNVLIVPLPHHGLRDRMTTEQSLLTAEEMAAYADRVLDIAQGLGEEVTMMGISAGGVLAAWAAHNRPDLDRAVLISPAFGFKALPTPLTGAYMRAYLILPNSFAWWDEEKKEAGGPDFAYPRYATRGLTQTLRLAQAVRAQAMREPFRAKSLVVINNANDTSVNNEMTEIVTAAWEKNNPGRVKTYEFPADLQLGHDIIEPTDDDANVEAVYPRLIEAIQGP